MSKFLSVIMIATICSYFPLFADKLAGPPQTGERILIIYCDQKVWPEFGYNAMETFSMALKGESPAPDFSPKPLAVDTVAITSGNGVIGDVLKRFGSEIPDSLKGGRELQYWSQVYDLRFRNLYTGQNEDYITIDIDDPTSDYNLYRNLLKNGGGLFVQGEYNVFLGRNVGVTTLINLLTKDNFRKENIANQGLKLFSDFPDEPESFATDFNDLKSMGMLALVHAGTYPMSEIEYAVPLMATGDNAHMLFWYSKDLVDQNGRMIVSFDINGWADKNEGSITEVTYASVQNIYDLLSGVMNYSVEKKFVPDHGDVGDEATFRIYTTNDGKTALQDFAVVDTVDTCLTVLSATPNWESKSEVAGVGTILEWTIDIAENETDSIVVNFRVDKFPE